MTGPSARMNCWRSDWVPWANEPTKATSSRMVVAIFMGFSKRTANFYAVELDKSMWHAHLARVLTGGTPVPLFKLPRHPDHQPVECSQLDFRVTWSCSKRPS